MTPGFQVLFCCLMFSFVSFALFLFILVVHLFFASRIRTSGCPCGHWDLLFEELFFLLGYGAGQTVLTQDAFPLFELNAHVNLPKTSLRSYKNTYEKDLSPKHPALQGCFCCVLRFQSIQSTAKGHSCLQKRETDPQHLSAELRPYFRRGSTLRPRER